MPQIWPMNWLFLLGLFILTFIFFICLTYFNDTQINSCNKTSSEVFNSNNLNTFNWKW